MGILQNSNAIPVTGSSGFYSHQIEQSCRFTSASSDSLSRTFGTSSDLTKFTFSCWVKRSLTYADGGNTSWQQIISRGTGVGGGGSAFGFESGGGTSGTGTAIDNRDRIAWYGLSGTSGGSSGGDDRIDGFFRDTTSWMHIVIQADTSQSSGSRVKYYVNGDLKTRCTTNIPAGDFNRFNTNGDVHSIGAGTDGGYDLDAYLAEVIFADGQSYAPTQFGEYKGGNIWIPKDPSGTTFGNNGFHLKFQNASALGDDSSGNNNDLTASGLGTDHQSTDSPTFTTV
tara:strand:+ start:451 stop:1299 length:849 start_codon:yes stop_codon:yes gene_type:complete